MIQFILGLNTCRLLPPRRQLYRRRPVLIRRHLRRREFVRAASMVISNFSFYCISFVLVFLSISH